MSAFSSIPSFVLHCSLEAKAPQTPFPKLASLVFGEVLPVEETHERLEDGRKKGNISFLSVSGGR